MSEEKMTEEEAAEDIFGEEDSENKEIEDSIKYAEKQLGTKMATPQKLPSDGHSPVKYDTDIQALVEKTTKETFQGLD